MLLHMLLDSIKAPNYVLDELIGIIRKQLLRGWQPHVDSSILNRQDFLKVCATKFSSTVPKLVKVDPAPLLEVRTEATDRLLQHNYVHAFDFMEQLQDIVMDPHLFGDMGNLVVNADDPWTPYHGQKDPYVVDEIMDGSWFDDTVAKYRLTDTDTFFVLPIIAYTDKTGTDLQKRYPLEL